MKTLVFATHNPNKVSEIQQMLPESLLIKSLKDIGCEDEIPETAQTLEGNARIKAAYVYNKYGIACFADDTGLEVQALSGDPGVDTAHYAGAHRSATDNMQKVLSELSGEKIRDAQFRTVISLFIDGKEIQFEGIAAGQIAEAPMGQEGFGYDPIFIPEGYSRSFGQLPLETKNRISHRSRAFAKLIEYLRQLPHP